MARIVARTSRIFIVQGNRLEVRTTKRHNVDDDEEKPIKMPAFCQKKKEIKIKNVLNMHTTEGS